MKNQIIPFGDPSWHYESSPYYYEKHRLVSSEIRKLVDKQITPNCFEWEEQGYVPRSIYRLFGEQGILAALVAIDNFPKQYYKGKMIGNLSPEDFDPFIFFVVVDELSRCGAGGVLAGIIGGIGIGLPPIIRFGSDKMKKEVITSCINGEKSICLAITEPTAGSDVASLKCTAIKSPDGKHYIVNGEKKWITNGTFADYFTTAVRTGLKGMPGISLLLIERTRPGIKTRSIKLSGNWSAGTAFITFSDVYVPVENLIGVENQGFKVIMSNFNHERLWLAMESNRFSRLCIEESISYANRRHTFGKKLIDHPVIRFKLAHLARQVESTHAWLESTVYQLKKAHSSNSLSSSISLLKAHSSLVLEQCAREASQIFGGLSYTRGGQGEKIERLYREVRAHAIPGGSEEIMLELGIKQALKNSKL